MSGAVRALLRRALQIGPLALASGVSLANSLVIAVLFARLAGPAAYGTYQMAFAAIGVASVLTLSGSVDAATRAAGQGRTAAWELMLARLPFCLGAGVVLLLVAGGSALLGNGSTAAGLAAAGLVLPVYVAADVYPAHLLGQRRFDAYLRFQLLLQSATVVAVVVALAIDDADAWVAIAAVGLTTAVVQFGGLLRLRHERGAVPEDSAYARKLTGISVLAALDARLDVLATGTLLGPAEAGLVAVARTLATVLRRVWDVLFQAVFAKMTSVSDLEAFVLAKRYRVPLAAGFAGLALVGAAVTPFVVPAVFGEEYEDAVLLAQLLLIANALPVYGYLPMVALRAQGDVKRLAVVFGGLPIVSLVVLPPAVWLLGIEGVGVRAVLISLIYAFLGTWLGKRRVRELRAAGATA